MFYAAIGPIFEFYVVWHGAFRSIIPILFGFLLFYMTDAPIEAMPGSPALRGGKRRLRFRLCLRRERSVVGYRVTDDELKTRIGDAFTFEDESHRFGGLESVRKALVSGGNPTPVYAFFTHSLRRFPPAFRAEPRRSLTSSPPVSRSPQTP
jgi:hypothetical protein